MKLTEKQKDKIRKEIEQEKRPRVLKFETEINKKKNQDKTIEEIMQMVAESKEVAKTFINDPEERFQKRLAELKIQELDKIRTNFNKAHDTDFSLKTFKRFNGIIADFDELTSFLDEFMTLVNCNNRMAISKNLNIWDMLMDKITRHNWWKACKEVRKEIPNITLKQFMLQNKHLTVAQAKEQFEELMTSVPEPTFQEFAQKQIEATLMRITDKPQELAKLVIHTKLKRNITDDKYQLEKDIKQIAQFGNLVFNALMKD